jgi:hypothetical protein
MPGGLCRIPDALPSFGRCVRTRRLLESLHLNDFTERSMNPMSSGTRVRIPLLIVAAGAIGAATALTIQAAMTRTPAPSTATALTAPKAAERAVAAPIADEVDWSKVDLSADPGPLAIAAYGP